MARHVLRLRRFVAQKVLHTDDTPHAIALGAGIATFITFLPLVGLQTVIAVSLAALFRANKAVCIPIVWITNVFTMVPIYGACLALGRFVLASPSATDEAAVLAALRQQQQTGFFDLAFWTGLWHRLAGAGLELWVGCTIVGVVLGVTAYFFALRGVVTYRERRRQKILRRNLLRSIRKSGKVARQSEPT